MNLTPEGLPVISVETINATTAKDSQKGTEIELAKFVKKIEREQPALAAFMVHAGEKTSSDSCVAMFMYRLFIRQAEANKLKKIHKEE